MDDLIAEGRLRAAIEVYREIERKDDELFAWCKERRAGLFVEIDDACQEEPVSWGCTPDWWTQ